MAGNNSTGSGTILRDIAEEGNALDGNHLAGNPGFAPAEAVAAVAGDAVAIVTLLGGITPAVAADIHARSRDAQTAGALVVADTCGACGGTRIPFAQSRLAFVAADTGGARGKQTITGTR